MKKWSPPNLSFLSTALAISVIDREEVLDAKMVSLYINQAQIDVQFRLVQVWGAH